MRWPCCAPSLKQAGPPCAALAERIVELLDNPDQARAIGQTARETVECEFNVDRMVKQTANLYREVLDPRPLPV